MYFTFREVVMTVEFILTVWAIRVALLLLALAVVARWCDLAGRPSQGLGWRRVRAIWVVGCLFAWLHVLAVFGFVMNWSHQNAIEDTARRTQQQIGVSFGEGVYFNYAFLLVWSCDAAWWCGWADHYRRRAWLWDALVIGYLGFIAFNATVVFESGLTRWVGLAATLALIVTGYQSLVARKRIR